MVDLSHDAASGVDSDGEDDADDLAAQAPDPPLSEAAEQLLDQALLLSIYERSTIARLLYESIADEEDDEDPAEVEAAWAEEIKRRVDEIRTGAVEGIDADEVMAELRARYG
jgi:putative addiction module component (TIGR02574 family)